MLLEGKKVSGILTENVFSGQKLCSTLWGIGVNVNNPLPAELQPMATNLSACLGKRLNLAEVEERLMKHLLSPFDFTQYQQRMAYVGETVCFCVGETTFSAKLVGVTERGGLLLERAGKTEEFAYGEIAFSKAD